MTVVVAQLRHQGRAPGALAGMADAAGSRVSLADLADDPFAPPSRILEALQSALHLLESGGDCDLARLRPAVVAIADRESDAYILDLCRDVLGLIAESRASGKRRRLAAEASGRRHLARASDFDQEYLAEWQADRQAASQCSVTGGVAVQQAAGGLASQEGAEVQVEDAIAAAEVAECLLADLSGLIAGGTGEEASGGGDEICLAPLELASSSSGRVAAAAGSSGARRRPWQPGSNTAGFISRGLSVQPQAQVLIGNAWRRLEGLQFAARAQIRDLLPDAPGNAAGTHRDNLAAQIIGSLLCLPPTTVARTVRCLQQNDWQPVAPEERSRPVRATEGDLGDAEDTGSQVQAQASEPLGAQGCRGRGQQLALACLPSQDCRCVTARRPGGQRLPLEC